MDHINFLRILLCLLLHVSILYPSEVEDAAKNRQNPLMNVETYLDNSRNFTLDNAKKVIQERKDTINFQAKGSCRPLEWLCMNGYSLAPLNEENRLQIATFFLENGASNESIEEAWVFCLLSNDRPLQCANSKIKEFLRHAKKERDITIEVEEITREIEIRLKSFQL